MFESLTIPSPKRNAKLQTGWEGFFPYYAGFPESFASAILSTVGVSTDAVIWIHGMAAERRPTSRLPAALLLLD